MDIQNGIASQFLNEAQIEFLNEHFNGKYPGVDAKITVNLNRSNYEDENDFDYVMRYVLTYKHPISPEKETWFAIEQSSEDIDVTKGIESVLAKHRLQTTECAHDFTRPTDAFGQTYPDGRSLCNKCELKLKKHLDPIPNKQVIKMAMSSDGVVAQFDWGDTYVQGGDDGLVLAGKRSYTTAFVEAFPKIHGMGTFIRGEGTNVQEAERQCWDIYQRMLSCDGHEWDRNVGGTYREDGYAQCKNCRMCTSDALEPLTLCSVCEKPTTKSFGDGYLCHKHYFETPEELRVAEHLEMMKDGTLSESQEAKYAFDYKFVSRAQALLFNALGEDEYMANKSQLRQIIVFMKHNFYVLVLGISPLRSRENYSEEECRLMDVCHQLMISELPLIISHIKGKKGDKSTPKLTYRNLIPKEYWDKDE